VATSVAPIDGRPAAPGRIAEVLSALGALMLAGEAAVHAQQFGSIFHEVAWIGPLFLANAAGCLLAIACLLPARTRPFAALAGIAISASALGGLAVSYGTGLFGWQEAGWHTATALAVVSEVGAVVLLAAALVASGMARAAALAR
jgi:hypothetical protein